MTIPIPKIGFGTWKRNGDEAYRTVQAALEIGYRHIDTAEAYGNEVEVGRAIAESGIPRKDVFVTTKVAPENLGPGQVMAHIKASLDRLKMDHVDLFLIHWPAIKDRYDVTDYMAQIGAVQDQGLTHLIGVSNFTRRHLDAAIKVLGANRIATNQVEAHVLFQNRLIVDHTKAKGIAVTAYCPLARGRLSGHAGVEAIAKRHGATAEQVGLAFLLAEGHIVIPSSSKRERIQSNWDAQKLKLSAEDVGALRKMDEGKRLVDGGWSPAWDS
jgi:2,5-diketo-D-gluconate reductase B